jgi:hypothetical protein
MTELATPAPWTPNPGTGPGVRSLAPVCCGTRPGP